MRRRSVSFAPAALDDLQRLGDWIAERSGTDVALRYVGRIEAYCLALAHSGERGQRRDDVRPGLRVVGFERRIAIAFTISDSEVLILRIYYGGRNWTAQIS